MGVADDCGSCSFKTEGPGQTGQPAYLGAVAHVNMRRAFEMIFFFKSSQG